MMMMKQREAQEDDMYGPMFYFTEEDAIESVRAKIGNREIKGGYKPPVDLTAETEAAEEETEEEESPEEKEEREAKEDPELAEVDVKLLTDQKLSYITPGDGVQEAQAYMTYLVQEKGFKIMTYPEGSEGEIPKEAPQPTPEAKEDDKEEKEDKEDKDDKDDKDKETEDAEGSEDEEEDAFIPPEEGYYIAAIDNKSTVEEGTSPELKRVRMEYTYDSYTLRLSTANGVTSDLIPPEPEEEEETGPTEVTLTDAVNELKKLPNTVLQLPKPTAEYEITPIQGRVVLEDIDFYNVRAYEEGPEKTLIYGGSYYISNDGQSVYKHDEMTGETTCISGEDILAQARQQNNQTEVNENAAVLSGNQ